MSPPEPWPPRPVVWTGAVVTAVAGAALVTRFPHSPWPALLFAAALAFAAVAVQRGVRARAQGPADQPRAPRGPAPDAWRRSLERRPLLARGLAAVAGLFVVAGAGALVRFGPRLPPSTGWSAGVRLLDHSGDPVRAADVVVGSTVTVWPEGAPLEELATVVVLRLPRPAAPAEVRRGTVDGSLVAYSRICTHAGCPVALFRAEAGLLYCPCHQATFDAVEGADPVFGPASRPLPQLPLGTDADGYLVAAGDLTAPPGPARGS